MRLSTGRLLVVVALLAIGSGVPVAISTAGAQASPEGNESGAGVQSIEITGAGVAQHHNGTTYLWHNQSLVVNASVVPFDGENTLYEVCLRGMEAHSGSNSSAEAERYGCQDWELGARAEVGFVLDRPDLNSSHRYKFAVSMDNGNRSHTATVPVYVVERGGDLDEDGLANGAEIDNGTLLNDPDTDSDGVEDGAEVTKWGTDPLESDTDGDGVRDAVEINRGLDPRDADTDDDGLDDGAELHEYGTDPNDADTDGDGMDDGREVEVGRNPAIPDGDTPGGDSPADLSAAFLGVTVLLLLVGVVVGAGALYPHLRPTGDEADGTAGSDRSVEGQPASAGTFQAPEERVHQLIDESGGQIKQSAIVDATDWSKAKVSRTLSAMEDDGQIERLRIGRENVVTHPDEPDGD